MVEDKRRFQHFIREQKNGEPGIPHRRVDAFVPVFTERHLVVVPYVEKVMFLKYGQLCEQPFFPCQPVSAMAVADENSGLVGDVQWKLTLNRE